MTAFTAGLIAGLAGGAIIVVFGVAHALVHRVAIRNARRRGHEELAARRQAAQRAADDLDDGLIEGDAPPAGVAAHTEGVDVIPASRREAL